MQRKELTEKVLVLGIDSMDPRLTRKYVDMGLMPNVKKYIEMGSCRHDLVLLGGHPTVTPPMWTTLACGCYANVHGITGFFRATSELGATDYNIDSRNCKAEQMWNVLAEAGKKTLVWHWPGSSWPPSSNSPNLMVVDGSSPGVVNMSIAQVETACIVEASTEIAEAKNKARIMESSEACVVTGLDLEENDDTPSWARTGAINLIYKESQLTTETTNVDLDRKYIPIKEASGWLAAPADAKEFIVLLSNGLIRRPALILKNDDGIYDRVAVYKSKKDETPLVVCKLGEMMVGVIDEAFAGNVKYPKVNRNYKLLRMDENGDNVKLYVSAAMDATNDTAWHPKRLFQEVSENIGFPPPNVMVGCQDPMLVEDVMRANWDVVADWQASSILHLIESENLDVVFSHFHNCDMQEHMFVKHLAKRPFNKQPVEVVAKWMEKVYVQTDEYLGRFMHLIDEGWTILIVSDHAQVAPAHDLTTLVDMCGLCAIDMVKLGYTHLLYDEKGVATDIDWTKTTAIIHREGHVYLNIKGRNKHVLPDGSEIDGLVDPADQYEMEEKIMTDLYSLKSPETGHRVVSVALRNRDAVLLGQGGPEAGDICVWIAEGYNYDHADCLSTTWGEGDTSVSPIFIATGKGIKKGFETDRIIRQVDVAPTIAFLTGTRIPAQCEGAPVYQIFAEEI